MPPATLNLDQYYRGDAWDGLHIGPMSESGLPLPSPCVSARMHFRNPKTSALGHALSSTPAPGEGLITIVSAANYEFDIPRQVLSGLDAGKWLWDFETIDAAGLPSTWIKGELTVAQDQTYG